MNTSKCRNWIESYVKEKKKYFDKSEAPKLVHMSKEIQLAMFLRTVLTPDALKGSSNEELLEMQRLSITLFYSSEK